jgi:oligoendopeptidase F
MRKGHCNLVHRSVLLATLLCLLIALPVLAYEPDATAPRSSVPTDYQWQWDDIFPTSEAWEAELSAFEADLPKLGGFKGRLGESGQVLYDAQEAVYGMLNRFYRLMVYAQLQFDVDQGNSAARTNQGRVQQLGPKFGQETSYIEPELLTIPREKIEGWMREMPELQVYKYYFSELWRQQEHTLDGPGEKLMAIASRMRNTAGDTHEALLGVDVVFPTLIDDSGQEVKLTLNNFSTYRGATSYAVRKQAAEAFFGTLRSYENTFAVLLNGVVQNHIATKEARGYSGCLEASLAPDNISTDAYRMLVGTSRENLPRTLHKYVALRQKVLGLDGPLTFANLYNPLLPDADAAYDYDQGREMITKALQPLGKGYVKQAAIGMDPASGWTDIYPNEDKRSGAYSNGVLAAQIHPYVLQNFDNTLDAVFTTAHEYGHAMHSWYSSHNQPPVYRGYTTFLAEIASTCNEALLTNHLLDEYKKDVDMKLLLLNQRLESIRLTIFRQTLFADFELQFHEHAEAGNPLTAEYLNGLYADLIKTYYGTNFELAENDECEWAFIHHFYYNFYVFSYATGLTSGLALAEGISKHGDKAADRYVDNMLKAGSSAPPLDILRSAGVDLETPAPILRAMDLFERTIEEFDQTWTKAYGKEG